MKNKRGKVIISQNNRRLTPGAGSAAARKKRPNQFMLFVASGRGWPKDQDGNEIRPAKETA